MRSVLSLPPTRPNPLLVAIIVLTLLASSCGNPTEPVSDSGEVVGLVRESGLSNGHVEGLVTYPRSPPLGGDHVGVWQDCGFYAVPVLDETAVHSLEHGVVWLAYEPGTETDELVALAAGNDRLLISAYPGINAPVVATAWGAQIALEGPDDPRLREFIIEFLDADGAPEPGASCAGGFSGTAQEALDGGFGE